MWFAGVLPEDAPDPRLEAEHRVGRLTFPFAEFAPQPSLARTRMPSFTELVTPAGTTEMSVSFSYKLLRNPQDPSDPNNLAVLDDRTRASIESEPERPRPAWLIEMMQERRYPSLWEAVRTSWTRAGIIKPIPLCDQLVLHANHILRNQFRSELGLRPGPAEGDEWKITSTGVKDTTAEVDEAQVPAIEIDTNPFVYAIGFAVTADVVTTVVLSREDMPHVEKRFAIQNG
jgi:hypothetical protein